MKTTTFEVAFIFILLAKLSGFQITTDISQLTLIVYQSSLNPLFPPRPLINHELCFVSAPYDDWWELSSLPWLSFSLFPSVAWTRAPQGYLYSSEVKKKKKNPPLTSVQPSRTNSHSFLHELQTWVLVLPWGERVLCRIDCTMGGHFLFI